MGQSLIPPSPLPPAHVTHALSGSTITSEQRNDRMIHGISERGLTAEYPVRYQIGGDFMGRTYIVQMGDYMFESPITWFKRYGWDLSPGYSSKPLIDFDRPIDDTCLFCHTDAARFKDPDGHRLQSTELTAVSCDRCHGPGDAHVRHPAKGNIINPPKLARVERDSICEQCHLEGATRILNPGKRWMDFRAGQAAEGTFATYVLSGGQNSGISAVDHVEQLGQSKCVRASGGKLWCGSCHNPHEAAVNRAQEIKSVCTSCHPRLSRAAHPAGQTECTSCHMPSGSTTDIPHAARTDHRILRVPSEANALQNTPPKVLAWRDPPASLVSRDLGLAEVLAGFSNQLPDIARDGVRLLQTLPEKERQQDPAILSDLEGLALQQGNLEEALRIGRRTVELNPDSAKAAMNLGLVLKASGDAGGAEQELIRAIKLDPSLKQAYMELVSLYARQGQREDVNSTMERYLNFNPQDILFRLQKAQAR